MTNKKSTYNIPFVNDGKEFELPVIKVSDIRAMQQTRTTTDDPDFKELEASITLVRSVLSKLDDSVTIEQVENWDYSAFVQFVKALWEKNAENFRGILPNLQKQTMKK